MPMKSIVAEKSYHFAVRIVKLCKFLRNERKEYQMSGQLQRCGTSIGANLTEAQQAQSRADFHAKCCISLKEASETKYWLSLLLDTDYLTQAEFRSIYADCCELEKMLVAIVRSTKQ